jgi:hypothetical protein
MKMQRISWWIVGNAVVLIGVGLASTWAQDQPSDTFTPLLGRPVPAGGREFQTTPQAGYGSTAVRAADDLWGGADSKTLIRKAAEELRDANAKGDSDAMTKAETNLRDLLSKYFDEDMKRREADLKKMESRLKKLQEQLGRRQEKMQEIVDLQFKVLINEADGLGFFSNSPSAPGATSAANPYYFYSPRTTEEGTATIQQAPVGGPYSSSAAPTREPTPVQTFDPTPAEEEPSQPRTRLIVPDSR